MARPYVPLHLHSDYSVLDGASKISELIAIAQENNMPAMALTDHGVMHGALELYQKGKAANVNPIIGVEAYVIDGDPKDRVSKQHYNHLVLLAKDKTGYQNLTRLVSKSHLEGFYYKPRMNWEEVAEHSEGLIALSGCLSG